MKKLKLFKRMVPGLTALYDEELIQPTVEIENKADGKVVANVFCCYWNNWKGLVREKATIVFDDNQVESCIMEDYAVLFEYHSGIRL